MTKYVGSKTLICAHPVTSWEKDFLHFIAETVHIIETISFIPLWIIKTWSIWLMHTLVWEIDCLLQTKVDVTNITSHTPGWEMTLLWFTNSLQYCNSSNYHTKGATLTFDNACIKYTHTYALFWFDCWAVTCSYIVKYLCITFCWEVWACDLRTMNHSGWWTQSPPSSRF